jgi:hypothetical protein
VRERGVQSRRGRAIEPERVRRSGPPGRPGGGGFWQALAIVALIVATAGWTTVAVLALRPQPVAQANPTPTAGPSDVAEDTPEPDVASHTVPDLEAQLPRSVGGTALVSQSWTGDQTLADDPFSVTLTAYLTSLGKTPVDLQSAQAYDPAATVDPTTGVDTGNGIDLGVGVFRLVGSDATALRDHMIKAWQDGYPDVKITSVTLGGKKVTKGDFGAGAVNSYWYVLGNLVYDVETADETLATAAIKTLADASGSPAPSGSSKPPASPAASRSPAASPS